MPAFEAKNAVLLVAKIRADIVSVLNHDHAISAALMSINISNATIGDASFGGLKFLCREKESSYSPTARTWCARRRHRAIVRETSPET